MERKYKKSFLTFQTLTLSYIAHMEPVEEKLERFSAERKL